MLRPFSSCSSMKNFPASAQLYFEYAETYNPIACFSEWSWRHSSTAQNSIVESQSPSVPTTM
ncbi:hypothetical protein RchiOBHm_Chr5g0022781 [Rosa chinensis]|uniref:Uncharacterized protein n=1 Tax=Rosa chinensis TaxID=74649 RepID=A0A2P6Q7W4_ROSCH|nr:hypothetical protein RchiOBHm_Chr5g0022781 [Rosa chinensis]